MNGWTVHQLLEATGGQLVRGFSSEPVRGISIDSRTLRPGDAFVAIRGTRLDGHRFIAEAIHGGSACLILSQLPPPTNGVGRLPTIQVEDTTKALGDLARLTILNPPTYAALEKALQSAAARNEPTVSTSRRGHSPFDPFVAFGGPGLLGRAAARFRQHRRRLRPHLPRGRG